MLPAALPSLIVRLMRRRLRPLEPADMGTAFGMEQWLYERDHGARPAATPASAPGWLPRWLQSSALRRSR